MRVIRHEEPRGVSLARNAGIEAARAPWIAFLDDDDLWAPGKLAAQLARAQETGAGLVYTSVVVLDDAGAVVGELTARPEAALASAMRETNAIGTPSSVLVRAELLRETGGFDPRLAVFADWDLMLRLLRLTSAAACAEHLTAYTEHASNMSLARAAELRAELELMNAGPAGPVGGAALERWLAAEPAARRYGPPRRGGLPGDRGAPSRRRRARPRPARAGHAARRRGGPPRPRAPARRPAGLAAGRGFTVGSRT